MKFATLGALALALAGCVAEEKVSFVALSGQQVIIRDGMAGLVSRGARTIVVVSPASRGVNPGQRPILVVGVRNISGAPVNFLLSNVRVRQSINGAMRDLPVKTYEQLVQEERTRQVVAAILVGAAAGANSYAAANQYRSPVAQQIALNQASYENAQLAGDAMAQAQFNLAALEANVLKDNTVMPGELIGGQVHFEAPADDDKGVAKNYRVSIDIAGETHDIDVVQTRISRR
ncbi:hypothetical protein ACIKTA_09400 [Hansschlegelia beijingensis]